MAIKETHICIVSDRLLPNLIPILMEKPQQIFLITSDEFKKTFGSG